MREIRNGLLYNSLVITLGLLCTISATARRDGNSDTVRAIRAQYTHIETNSPRYTMRTRDLPGYSTEGGTLTGYYRGSALQKLVATYYGETGKNTEECYFHKDRVIFVLITRSDYNHSTLHEGRTIKVARITQEHLYFDNGKLIHRVQDNNQETPMDAGEELNQIQQLLKVLRAAK